MAITGINNSSYTSYYASNYKNTVKKTDSEKDSTNTKDGNVTTSTVELKTSRPGVTKTEQIKTGYSNVNDYSKYLQGKYHYMNIGLTSMQGIPTTVSVSSAFLQKCMNDPEKAKYLEENLAAIPDCAKSAVNGCLGTLTNLSYNVDENGNISVAISGTNDPDGKIAKENAERKAKENREKEKKVKAPERLVNYRTQLIETLKSLLSEQNIDENRIIQECAIMADKMDITEEIVRMGSHLQQFKASLEMDGNIGRKLDFIVQEMNRETNTMASKANNAEIANLVVEIKGELEKIREQIQNIE